MKQLIAIWLIAVTVGGATFVFVNTTLDARIAAQEPSNAQTLPVSQVEVKTLTLGTYDAHKSNYNPQSTYNPQ
jgi:hypothetical protein